MRNGIIIGLVQMTELEEVRNEISEIDGEIVSLIARRTKLAEKVLESKKEMDKAINDETQNQAVIGRATNAATELNLDTGAVKQIFEILIKMNIERQHELRGEGNLP